MPASKPTEQDFKEAVSVSEMARMVGLSRARFYELVAQGVFVPPVHSVSSKRPYFNAELQERNLQVRQTHRAALTGETVLFNEKRCSPPRPAPPVVRRTGRRRAAPQAGLVEGVKSLGIEATAAQVEQALASCFPSGTVGHEETAVLRTIYRHLRRSTSGNSLSDSRQEDDGEVSD